MKKHGIPLTAVAGDVFAGLFAYGVRAAGFEVLAHLENSSYGYATARANFPTTPIFNGTENWSQCEVKHASLMFTNPPCAPWSSAGTRYRSGGPTWRNDPRLKWIDNLRLKGRELDVYAWVWESVVNAFKFGRSFVDDMARWWIAEGYAVTVILQNNMHLGAPQDRKRMFFVAHRYPLVFAPLVEQPRSLREVLSSARKPTKNEMEEAMYSAWDQRLWRDAPRFGGSLNRAARAIQPPPKNRGAIPSVLRVRQSDDTKPPHVFIVAYHYPHLTEPRMLNWPEVLALVGFNKNEKFVRVVDDINNASREMTRAVLPRAGEWIARTIAGGFTQRLLDKREFKVIDIRKPSERTEEVVTL